MSLLESVESNLGNSHTQTQAKQDFPDVSSDFGHLSPTHSLSTTVACLITDRSCSLVVKGFNRAKSYHTKLGKNR